MVELSKDQLRAVVNAVYTDLNTSYNARRAAKEKEVIESKQFEEIFKKISDIRTERNRLQKELNKLTTSGEKLLNELGLSPYLLNYNKEDFIRGCVSQIVSKEVNIPSREQIKDMVILQTIQCNDLDNLLETIKKKFI